MGNEDTDPLANIGLTAHDVSKILEQESLGEQHMATAKIIQAKAKGKPKNQLTPKTPPQNPDHTPPAPENQMDIEMSPQPNPHNV